MENVVQLNGVSKAFQGVKVLEGVSLRISSGEIVGILGANGAGKTTFLKILAGLLSSDEGEVQLFGEDLSSHSGFKEKVGWMPGSDRSFYGRITGHDNLKFFGILQGLSYSEIQSRLKALSEHIYLQDALKTSCLKCSEGMRQRLSLARSLLHDPSLLLLDEPMRSLDPIIAKAIKQFLRNWVRQKQRAILWATHNVSEAFDLSHRVVFFQSGRIVICESPKDLQSRFPRKTPAEIYEVLMDQKV